MFSHIVLDNKRDGRHKTLLVADGHRQQPGMHVNEAFVPVCSHRMLSMIAVVAARPDCDCGGETSRQHS